MLNYDCLIGSFSKGYWIIDSEHELEMVINSFNRRADGVRKRGVALQENWKNIILKKHIQRQKRK